MHALCKQKHNLDAQTVMAYAICRITAYTKNTNVAWVNVTVKSKQHEKGNLAQGAFVYSANLLMGLNGWCILTFALVTSVWWILLYSSGSINIALYCKTDKVFSAWQNFNILLLNHDYASPTQTSGIFNKLCTMPNDMEMYGRYL